MLPEEHLWRVLDKVYMAISNAEAALVNARPQYSLRGVNAVARSHSPISLTAKAPSRLERTNAMSGAVALNKNASGTSLLSDSSFIYDPLCTTGSLGDPSIFPRSPVS